MWRNRTAFRPNMTERIDRLFAEEDCPPALVVIVDAWTSFGGTQFIDSPGTGTLRRRTSATTSCRSSTPATGRSPSRAPRPHRQVERWLRRDGGTDAAARRVRRARDALRRRALRALLPPGVPRHRAHAARRVRRLVRALLGGLPLAARVHEVVGPHPPEHVRDGGVLLGQRGRLGRPPVRHGDRNAARGRLAALARLGSGADGAAPRRCAAQPARDLHRRGQDATSTSSTSAPRPFGASSQSSGSPTSSSSCSTRSTAAIEYRYPLAIRYLAERLQ